MIQDGQSDFLTETLEDVICTLIPQATHFARAGQETAGDAGAMNLPLEIIELLVQAMVQCGSTEGIARIGRLPPFPSAKGFDCVRKLKANISSHLKSEHDIGVFLQVFGDLKEPVPLEVQKATLNHLHEQLQVHF